MKSIPAYVIQDGVAVPAGEFGPSLIGRVEGNIRLDLRGDGYDNEKLSRSAILIEVKVATGDEEPPSRDEINKALNGE